MQANTIELLHLTENSSFIIILEFKCPYYFGQVIVQRGTLFA